MSNKAQIKHIPSKAKGKDRIEVTFQEIPELKLRNKLWDKGFIPDRKSNLKKWQITSKGIMDSFFECCHNQLIRHNLLVDGLGSPYIPADLTCTILDTVVPDSMDYEAHIAVRQIRKKVGGSFQKYVMEKLKYSREELCHALASEQVDAVALAIYNIEVRNQGMIIGDQTGIGKGRVAAAMIRYGRIQGKQPIFLSEKPNLFSDIYRDLKDIGSPELKPFIVNGRESKTDVKDEDGNIVYQAPEKNIQDDILKSMKLPLASYDYIMSTYSQFNSPEKKFVKPMFLKNFAQDNIIIMDEAHNASGSSNTGTFMKEMLAESRGVVFLSATFAKRPDNMPIYAMKTAMQEANLNDEQLVSAIITGGVALQEVISSELVGYGQMIRRERSFEGVEVNYISLDEKAEEHKATSDNITSVIRDIIEFQKEHVDPMIDQMDEIIRTDYAEAQQRKGTSAAGIDNTPFFSKVFNVVNQMLFSIKAEAVAERAIARLKEGKKPVIAFSSTMGSFLETMEKDNGELVGTGDTINADFKEVLMKGLRGVMRYTVKSPDPYSESGKQEKVEYKYLEVSELDKEGQAMYHKIVNQISQISTGITISPIDIIIQKIQDSGFTVAEVTGRKYSLQFTGKNSQAVIESRKKLNTNDAFRLYNNNEIDCLMINQSGATGASAHAIITGSVPAEHVKQRVMIILQAELDINKEVQKRGRINRTGQIYKPIYDYVNSAIPAEKRLMMMLRKKLKSLDANTTSNQKQSDTILKSDDFLNKYGNKIVTAYLLENPELNEMLGDPLKFNDEEGEKPSGDGKVAVQENAAHKVSGRVAVLAVTDQEKFYNDVLDRYNDYVMHLRQMGEYDLEVEDMNLEAETQDVSTPISGKGGESAFGEDTKLEKCQVNNLRKPFTKAELMAKINTELAGRDPVSLQVELKQRHRQHVDSALVREINDLEENYKTKIENIVNEKKYLALQGDARQMFYNQRRKELLEAKALAIEKAKITSQNRFEYLDDFFEFFYVSRAANYPDENAEFFNKPKAIFLGYNIDEKRDNPFVPSAVKLKFAISNNLKYIVLPASGETGNIIQAIMGGSQHISGLGDVQSQVIENWDQIIQKNSTNRVTRYIVTGNLLQGFAMFNSGKLVSYTLKDGGVKKGILMPDNWNKDKMKKGDMVAVPIIKALQIIKELRYGQRVIDTSGKLMFENSHYGYMQLTMPKSRAYSHIYLDKNLVSLMQNTRDGFNMVSGSMVGVVPFENIKKVVELLQDKSVSVNVSQYDYENNIEKTAIRSKTADIEQAEKELEQDRIKFAEIMSQKAENKPKQDDDRERRMRMAKVKMKMLKLKLELMKTS